MREVCIRTEKILGGLDVLADLLFECVHSRKALLRAQELLRAHLQRFSVKLPGKVKNPSFDGRGILSESGPHPNIRHALVLSALDHKV